jgi:multiple antibiotic resistance protein
MAITPEMLVPSTFQHYLLGLFAVANNFPAIGPFLTLSQGVPASQVRRVIRITTFSSLLIMLGAYFLGTAVLQVFGIGVSPFRSPADCC